MPQPAGSVRSIDGWGAWRPPQKVQGALVLPSVLMWVLGVGMGGFGVCVWVGVRATRAAAEYDDRHRLAQPNSDGDEPLRRRY